MSSNLQYILMPFLLLLIAIYIVAMDAKLVIAAPSRRKPREFLKVTQYEVKETEPSFIPPEEIVQEYEEKDGPEPHRCVAAAPVARAQHPEFQHGAFLAGTVYQSP